jgi:hypothetical protein
MAIWRCTMKNASSNGSEENAEDITKEETINWEIV